ncbi:hypothetical protein RN001_003754 [Aquatica leii]|uniref:Uncharacterized protein n=1 Tax=Aquatica leii TaxID=1421715 RepID=A0AAN7PJ16_9COLE|nr:hypothetical protein RN001_003754 [Aquatica leii]
MEARNYVAVPKLLVKGPSCSRPTVSATEEDSEHVVHTSEPAPSSNCSSDESCAEAKFTTVRRKSSRKLIKKEIAKAKKAIHLVEATDKIPVSEAKEAAVAKINIRKTRNSREKDKTKVTSDSEPHQRETGRSLDKEEDATPEETELGKLIESYKVIMSLIPNNSNRITMEDKRIIPAELHEIKMRATLMIGVTKELRHRAQRSEQARSKIAQRPATTTTTATRNYASVVRNVAQDQYPALTLHNEQPAQLTQKKNKSFKVRVEGKETGMTPEQVSNMLTTRIDPTKSASPDGLTSDGCCVEVKCVLLELNTKPISDIGDVIELKKTLKKPFCLEKKDSVIRLKRNHNYYLQVQVRQAPRPEQQKKSKVCPGSELLTSEEALDRLKERLKKPQQVKETGQSKPAKRIRKKPSISSSSEDIEPESPPYMDSDNSGEFWREFEDGNMNNTEDVDQTGSLLLPEEGETRADGSDPVTEAISTIDDMAPAQRVVRKAKRINPWAPQYWSRGREHLPAIFRTPPTAKPPSPARDAEPIQDLEKRMRDLFGPSAPTTPTHPVEPTRDIHDDTGTMSPIRDWPADLGTPSPGMLKAIGKSPPKLDRMAPFFISIPLEKIFTADPLSMVVEETEPPAATPPEPGITRPVINARRREKNRLRWNPVTAAISTIDDMAPAQRVVRKAKRINPWAPQYWSRCRELLPAIFRTPPTAKPPSPARDPEPIQDLEKRMRNLFGPSAPTTPTHPVEPTRDIHDDTGTMSPIRDWPADLGTPSPGMLKAIGKSPPKLDRMAPFFISIPLEKIFTADPLSMVVEETEPPAATPPEPGITRPVINARRREKNRLRWNRRRVKINTGGGTFIWVKRLDAAQMEILPVTDRTTTQDITLNTASFENSLNNKIGTLAVSGNSSLDISEAGRDEINNGLTDKDNNLTPTGESSEE